jgi:hypothetical protein
MISLAFNDRSHMYPNAVEPSDHLLVGATFEEEEKEKE